MSVKPMTVSTQVVVRDPGSSPLLSPAYARPTVPLLKFKSLPHNSPKAQHENPPSKLSITPQPSAQKPLQTIQTNTPAPSKVWVLPPRPKPGRKPATDVPATKRKAQNREAQRAFRDRRAARVTELEEILSDVRSKQEVRERELNESIRNLTQENGDLRKSLDELKNDIAQLKTLNLKSRSDRAVQWQLSTPANSVSGPSANVTLSPSPVPSSQSPMDDLDRALELRLPVTEKTRLQQKRQLPEIERPSFRLPDYTTSTVPIKRRSATLKMNPFKKIRVEDIMETDFTEAFAKNMRKNNRSITLNNSLGQRCCSCSPGSPCICLESINLSLKHTRRLSSLSNYPHRKLSSFSSQEYQGLASPISLVPVDQQYMGSPEKRLKPSSDGCTGNPGNCSQCQADPMSTLFCTTLASRVYASTTVKSSWHTISSSRSSITDIAKKPQFNNQSFKGSGEWESAIDLPPGTPSTITPSGTFIPCAAAYQALSRHKGFVKADLSSLIEKLNTRGMKVEVGSVANVLRELDRRFSTDKEKEEA